MVYPDLVSARNRNNSIYEPRSNVRTTLTKQQQQQQQEVSNNARNNTLSYGQAVTGVPTDATSNNNHNSTDRITQSTTYLNDVRFEVFTAVTMKNAVFWDVTPCGSCENRRFGGT
jgi:membrane carboxypeptidase/penicillin-binding protein